MRDTEYNRELNAMVNLIFSQAFRLKLNVPALADRAKVSPGTVYKMRKFETRFPRLHTVMKLAKAVGLEIRLSRVKKVAKLAS